MKTLTKCFLFFTLFGSASCGNAALNGDVTTSDASSVEAGGSGIPSAVATILQNRCVSCHGTPPQYGAPMSLTTASDFQANARSTPSERVAVRTISRINDVRNPMPPSGLLPESERQVLQAWLASGAPPCTGESCTTTALTGAGLPTIQLPCPESEQVHFRAHAQGNTNKYPVPAEAGNANICFAFRSPFTRPTQLTASRPVIDDARVVHHWILFETATPQTEGSAGPCRMPADAVFVTGWAPGNPGNVLPPDVGIELPGSDRWFILQLHYWNAAGLTDANDASGVSMCTTTQLRPKNAAVHMLGSAAIALPPRSSNTEVVGNCTVRTTQPVHILGASPHMHRLARSMTSQILRGGNPAQTEVMLDVPNYNFNDQVSYPRDVTLQPGDVLRTTCRYDNPSDQRVYFGERTEDEMCFNFVLAWPAGGLANTAMGGRRCIDR